MTDVSPKKAPVTPILDQRLIWARTTMMDRVESVAKADGNKTISKKEFVDLMVRADLDFDVSRFGHNENTRIILYNMGFIRGQRERYGQARFTKNSGGYNQLKYSIEPMAEQIYDRLRNLLGHTPTLKDVRSVRSIDQV